MLTRLTLILVTTGIAGCAGPRMTLMTHFTRAPVPLEILKSEVKREGDHVDLHLTAAIAAGGDGALVIRMRLDNACEKTGAAEVTFDRPLPPHETDSILSHSQVRVSCSPGITLKGSIWGQSGFWGPELKEPFVIHFHDVPVPNSSGTTK